MVTYKPLRLILAALFLAGMSTVFLSACSTPPKPKELVELERILQAPDANSVKEAPGADKFFRESRQYRRVSLEAYEEGELERAQEYAVLGKLKYRTAAAIKEQTEAKQRLDAANAKVAEVNPKIQALSQERSKLQSEVGDIERQVAQARNMKAQEDRRKEALQNASLDRGNDTSAAESTAVRNKIEAAKKAKQEALAVKADEYAKGSFNRANNQLKSTLSLHESQSGTADSIIESANQTAELFRKAATEARPKYQEQQATMKVPARRQALREDAQNNFGGPFTIAEPTGVRVVLAMLFDEGSANVRPSSQALVKAAAELAKKYGEANIIIEGYTQKGNATENLATSALRAKAVRNFFESHGIKDSRMSTNGLGQTQIRYSDDESKNDRVEIIFRIPNQ
jgi:outer membrane protein OmpA-like peptidoglycan-associated protein